MRWLPFDVTKETGGEVAEFLEKVKQSGTKWKMAATSSHYDVLLDSEESHV